MSRTAPDIGDVGVTGQHLPALGNRPEESRFDPRNWWPVQHRGHPLELEIGSGKGTFLVQQAPLQPETHFLGIEYAREFWLYAADRCRRRGLANVRLLHYDAKVFVAWYAPDAIFRNIHIYFPDPWPKKRHHKRRLVEADFLRQCHRVLAPGGTVRIVTDHDDYFAWMEEHVGQVADAFEHIAFESPDATSDREIVGTNFERKYRREGRPFHAMALKRQ